MGKSKVSVGRKEGGLEEEKMKMRGSMWEGEWFSSYLLIES